MILLIGFIGGMLFQHFLFDKIKGKLLGFYLKVKNWF